MASSKYQTFRQKQQNHPAKQLKDVHPLEVNWTDGGTPATILFSDGKTSLGSCIHCTDPSCIDYSDEELTLEVFKDFPADKNKDVCPTSAITWPPDSAAPIINTDLCILCGLCVDRCPVHAVYLDKEGAHVNDEPNDHFLLQSTTTQIIDSTIELFGNIPEHGVYLTESDELLAHFYNRFTEVSRIQSTQYPNHLARNLLIAVGIGAAMRRLGDTNVRMDLALGPPGVPEGTGEVEFGSEILDTPRNILDNIAVLAGRYHISKDNIVPIIISSSLPNLRSEYWQVIKDIKSVLGVKISSLTIGALVILVWSRTKIALTTGDEFYVDVDSPSLRGKIERILERELNIRTGGYPGLLESEK